jgi:transcriptional regulator with XRE-family HTH domain
MEEHKMASSKRQSEELGTNDFGKLVRNYRVQRHWSQQQLADRWGYTREYVSQIERGKRKLDHVEQVNRLADILDIPSERLDEIGKGIPRRKNDEEHLLNADDALLEALLQPAESTVKLSWLVWHGDGDTTVIDNLTALIAKLETALQLYQGAFRRQSQQLLAYAYEMMGKIAFDRLNYMEANGYFNEMVQLGEKLKDQNITALALIHQADILRKRGRYELAIRCLDAAQTYADESDTHISGTRWKILARVYYEYGLEVNFLKAIDHAENIALQTQQTLSTKSQEFNLVEVLQERAQGYSMLWQPQKALEIYQKTDKLKPFRPMRDLGSYTIIKAQAHAYNGDIEEGIRLALNGLELARGYHSARHVARIQKMYDRLKASPLGQHGLLRDLQEALMSYITSC